MIAVITALKGEVFGRSGGGVGGGGRKECSCGSFKSILGNK